MTRKNKTDMPSNKTTQIMLAALEEELQRAVAEVKEPGTEALYQMLAYHLGWEGKGAGLEARGKRLRPVLLLMVCTAAGGDWQKALPAGAAVELVHNFSLIHDDIQDNSPLRRGRQTLWNVYGIPQAINAGDAMLIIANLSLLRLQSGTSLPVVTAAARILHQACLQLTQGQYLDLSYEDRSELSVDAYWPMVSGKTAALLAACSELGALVAQTNAARQANYRRFGYNLGLAFQAQDDLLGIWGDGVKTGKSAESDLVSGKKSLPVLYGLNKKGHFADRWSRGPVQPEDVLPLARQLEEEGARSFTQDAVNRLTTDALAALELAEPDKEMGESLRALALKLVQRNA
jgi:geranylgeranyl diphosphate synthase, type I